MTSKNILWLGSLLFILLTTSCIAWFLDKHNPDIQHVEYKTTTDHTTVVQTDPFAQDVQIDEFIGEHIKEEVAHIAMPSTTIQEHNGSKTERTSQKPAQKPVYIATKIDTSIIPKQQIPIKKVHTKKIHRRYPKRTYTPKKEFEIEPLLQTVQLEIKPNAKLHIKDKHLLDLLIRKAKQHPYAGLKIELSKISPKNRNYLKAIKRYLQNHGIHANRLHTKIDRCDPSIKIVSTQTNSLLEISLIERL